MRPVSVLVSLARDERRRGGLCRPAQAAPPRVVTDRRCAARRGHDLRLSASWLATVRQGVDRRASSTGASVPPAPQASSATQVFRDRDSNVDHLATPAAGQRPAVCAAKYEPMVAAQGTTARQARRPASPRRYHWSGSSTVHDPSPRQAGRSAARCGASRAAGVGEQFSGGCQADRLNSVRRQLQHFATRGRRCGLITANNREHRAHRAWPGMAPAVPAHQLPVGGYPSTAARSSSVFARLPRPTSPACAPASAAASGAAPPGYNRALSAASFSASSPWAGTKSPRGSIRTQRRPASGSAGSGAPYRRATVLQSKAPNRCSSCGLSTWLASQERSRFGGPRPGVNDPPGS